MKQAPQIPSIQVDRGEARKSRYVPALDGLRAFSVLAVIVYHMGLGWAPGGLMGVTVFFVISGYLINGLLVAEHERTGRISLKRFWIRRVRRIVPAVLVAIVGTAALCTVFDHVLLDKMRQDIVPSLLFFNNWWQVFRELSYFEAAGSPSPLTHFWSLSIEEQFYLVWPLLLLLMYRLGLGKKPMALVVLVLAILSAAEMMLLYDPMADPSRVYYGTDTRAFSLLLGVWLAFVWPSAAFGNQAGASVGGGVSRFVLDALGAVALGGIVAIVVFTNGYSSFPYYGGIAITTLLAAALIIVLTVPGTVLSRAFSWAPLVWIGKRSYGMYLWHYPVLLLTTDANSTLEAPWWIRIVQVALIFAVSALSYKFVEDPIRKGEFLRPKRRLQPDGTPEPVRPKSTVSGVMKAAVPAGCFAALLVVASYGVVTVAPVDYDSLYAHASSDAPQAVAGSSAEGSSGAASPSSEAGRSAGASSSSASADAAREPDSPSGADDGVSYVDYFGQQRYDGQGNPVYEPLLIGDSVAAGATDSFYQAYPYGHIDAEVKRNVWENPYDEYLEAGTVGEYVVLCLGTNNIVTQLQIDNELLGSISPDKKVFMVNARNTQEWLELTNGAIEAAPERHPNVTVIDWYGASEGHDEYFVGDGTHLSEEGAQAYMNLIQDSIRATFEQ